LRELDRVRSPEGKSLLLTSRAVRDGELFLVFFCENCGGVDAIKQAAGALYDVGSLQGSAGMSVRQFHATVFAGQRHTGWDFPPVIFVEGKRDGANQWVLPKLTRAQFVSLVEAKLRRR
jgi:hypothetical protein